MASCYTQKVAGCEKYNSLLVCAERMRVGASTVQLVSSSNSPDYRQTFVCLLPPVTAGLPTYSLPWMAYINSGQFKHNMMNCELINLRQFVVDLRSRQ
eukprot:1033540-Pelagomonas_calceolata.AAC.1